MNAKIPLSSAEKNDATTSLIKLIDDKSIFLLTGHTNPDEDCIGSLSAAALLLAKFRKDVAILLPGTVPQKVAYLLDICSYNRIPIFKQIPATYTPQVIAILDTPKPSMIDGDARCFELMKDTSIIKAEIDHHIAADAEYCGDLAYRLVTAASSTSELIGYLGMHLWMQKDMLKKYEVQELLSRNIVLSILTGISGDVKNGLAINTEKDLSAYNTVSCFFEEMLRKKTHKNSKNYATLTDIYDVIQSFSEAEHTLFKTLIQRANHYPGCSCLILEKNDVEAISKAFSDYSIFVNVIKSVTDALAEQSRRIGITVYWDRDDQSDMVQIRIRCAKSFQTIDLRDVISTLQIQNGGGHPGAIAIRFPKSEISDLEAATNRIRETVIALIPEFR